MRKFKFMSKAVVGMMAMAMTFGSLSALGTNAPIAVYAVDEAATAEATSITISGQGVVAPNTTSKPYSARVFYKTKPGTNSVTWSVTGGVTGTTIDSTTGALTVAEKETAKSLKIKATSTETTSVSAEFEVMVGTGAWLEIDYSTMTGKIKSNGADSFFFLEVLKDANGTKPGTVYCYEGEVTQDKSEIFSGNIDLSFLKLSKEGYVRVFGDQNPDCLKIYTIAAQPKKPAVKYVAGKDTFYASFELNKAALTDETVKTLQWKTQYGEVWSPFEHLEEGMGSLTVAGSTILVRAISPTAEAPSTAEVKVKIAAVPKAPKVTLDYAKNSIKLPKGSEIRVPDWIIPSEVKDGEDVTVVENPFYFTVGSNKDDLTVAPMTLAEKLLDQYVTEFNAAVDKLSDDNKAEYEKITTEPTKDGEDEVPSGKDDMLTEMTDGYKILVRTAKGKKAASQPTFVDVKAAPEIAIRQKEVTEGETKTMVDENVIAVMGVDDEGNSVATANTLTFEYTDTVLKLTSAGSYVYAYSVDGGTKFSKISKPTEIKLEKIDKSKGVIVRTEGAKEDAKKNIVGNWASNAITLPVSVGSVEIKGDAEITAATADVVKTYTVTVKDALGEEIKDAKVTCTATGTSENVVFDAEKLTLTVKSAAAATKVTITATCGDVKGTIDVEVKAKPEA